MQSAADIIAARLYQAGCRHAFGIPGGEVLALMDSLDRAGLRITLTKHENCAGFMGEGVHHADGAPAVLFATIGPGLANAANVIANAMQDRVPMIVLTGCAPAIERQTYTHQIFDHVKLCEPIAKAVFRVEPGTAGILIDKAVAIATEGRPGPVVLDVPIDVQKEMRDIWLTPQRQDAVAMVPADSPTLTTARHWFKEARKPVMIAGVDAINQNAQDDVAAFCQAHSIPLITTYKGKGILPEDDPLSLGAAGLSPKIDKLVLPFIKESDCILLAGYDPIEMRVGWQDPWTPDDRVIDITSEVNHHYMHQSALNIIGDISATLNTIADGSSVTESWAGGRAEALRADIVASKNLNENWGPSAISDAIRSVTPRDTVVTMDSGAHRIVLSQVWDTYVPRGVLQSSALCTMGSAVPLAIGRKLAEPDRPVIAFVGDAGLEMFLGELATARDLKLGLPVVVFVDEQLALIELKQRGMQMPNLGVEFAGTDFPAVARAMGGHGFAVRDREALQSAIKESFDRDTFTVIAAIIGRQAYDGRI
ncbi:thiamine pyrophosphate-binding protein [Coralliovum pocilloporae]|uniref:thiamine pyrophosphate-binding protein n=1 Tax=Coralliovum pocilloporae TaxID=3066369 RepID=UPI00330755F4